MTPEALIRIHRDEKDVGYFTPETAIECLKSGILREDDWAYCDGLRDWMYLGQLLGVSDFSSTPPPILKPPPLPALAASQSVPPAIPNAQRPIANKRAITAILVGGFVVCLIGLVVIELLFGSPSSGSSSSYTPTATPRFEGNSLQDKTPGLLPPLPNFDVNAEPIQAIPELGMSRADVANFREWMAAGAPRYWKGKDQFPKMSKEQWDQWSKSTRETLEKGRR